MRHKIKIPLMLLTIIIVSLSGCAQQTPSTPFDVTISGQSINIKILIEERTGDLENWQTKPVGWYNLYEDKKIRWFTDNMAVISSPQRDVGLILVTEDTDPNLVLTSLDGYYTINTDIVRINTVPRGYPNGGKRVYQITITYTISDMKDGNLLTIRNDFYDVKDELFHIEFDSNKKVEYS